MEHIMPYLPTFRIFSLPNDFLSYYPNRLVNALINTLFAFSIQFVSAATVQSLSNMGREWLLQCLAHGNHVLISLEQGLRPFIPFQPLFELCWFDTCWYLKYTAPFLLASRSPDQVWLSTELLAWIAVTLGMIYLGVLIVKLACKIARLVSYVVRYICVCCYWSARTMSAFTSRICASGVDSVVLACQKVRNWICCAGAHVPDFDSFCRAWVRAIFEETIKNFSKAVARSEGRQRAATRSAGVSPGENMSEAKTTSSSPATSEEQEEIYTQVVSVSAEANVPEAGTVSSSTSDLEVQQVDASVQENEV